jgi:FlaA1/EpsC-like NDP-sugar epimerase
MIKKIINQTIYKLLINLIEYPNYVRKLILVLIDLFIISISFYLSLLYLSYSSLNSIKIFNYENFVSFLILALITIVVYILTGHYKPITKFKESNFYYNVLKRNLFAILITFSLISIFNYSLTLRFLILYFALGTLFELYIRNVMSDLLIYNFEKTKNKQFSNVAIYGAGSGGVQLANALRYSKKFKIKFFIDDSPKLLNRDINGISIFNLNYLKKNLSKVDCVLLAIPSLSKIRKSEIISCLNSFNVKTLQIPSAEEIISGVAKVDKLSPINIEELLGRDSVSADSELLSSAIDHKVICITGAGGSIGSELCRQIFYQKPKKLILIDNSEINLYNLQKEIEILSKGSKIDFQIYLFDVSNEMALKEIFQKDKVDTIFHAAAYKHVPLVEENPLSGLQNNISSTLAICNVSLALDIGKVVLISSDKAVRPTNLMGASKRVCEKIMQNFYLKSKSEKRKTIFCSVRFGNVLGSSGSVVPLFKKQIEMGGPITLTHPEIIRFFMTIKEASQLVIQAIAMSKGGEIYLLDMGDQISIYSLAKRMINLYGLKVKDKNNNGDIAIKITGLRPGEKLFEELLVNDQSVPTKHPLIYKADEILDDKRIFENNLIELNNSISKRKLFEALEILKKMIPEWKSSELLKF